MTPEQKERARLRKNERQRLWYAAHREECQERQKASYLINGAERRAATREYQKKNPEKVNARNREWRRKNPQVMAESRNRHRVANLESFAERSRRYRAMKKGASILEVTTVLLDAKLAYWGGKCWMCRTAPHEQWDHVIPLIKGGLHCLSNLRPACRSCNASKGARWPYEVAA